MPADVRLLPPIVELYQYGDAWSLASADGECLGVQALMRMGRCPFRTVSCDNPCVSPDGQLPFLRVGSESRFDCLCGFDACRRFLVGCGVPMESHLSTEQAAEAAALLALVAGPLQRALDACLWCDRDGYAQVARPHYQRHLPWPVDSLEGRCLRAAIVDDIAFKRPGATLDDLLDEARDALAALAARLGSQWYFYGAGPSPIDARLFGILAVARAAPLKDSRLRDAIEQHPALVQHTERILATYFV